MLQAKRQKKDEDDEDLNFFKSLLPHVRRMSSLQKLEYRMQVLKLTKQFRAGSTAETDRTTVESENYVNYRPPNTGTTTESDNYPIFSQPNTTTTFLTYTSL